MNNLKVNSISLLVIAAIVAISLWTCNDSILLSSNFEEESAKHDCTNTFNNDKLNRLIPIQKRKELLSFETKTSKKIQHKKVSCKNWVVLVGTKSSTNISIVSYFTSKSNWCVCIVEMNNVSTESSELDTITTNTTQIVFLGKQQQEQMMQNFTFLNSLPWNHIARKNIGYLYAIHQGAEAIWDVDGNIEMIELHEIESLLKNEETFISYPLTDSFLYNPMPALGASVMKPWPRGFPLSSIKDNKTFFVNQQKATVPNHHIGIIQSMINNNPDVDSIYRMTGRMPLSFCEKSQVYNTLNTVPPGTLSPFNAKATLVKPSMFWMLYLPTTVEDNMSDIWRAYFSQPIAWHLEQLIAFSMPIASQSHQTNPVNNNLESQLYAQTSSLTKFLATEWKCSIKRKTTEECMMDLWISMYERGFIEIKDLETLKQWIIALHEIGYDFPEWKSFKQIQEYDHYSHGKVTSVEFSALGLPCIPDQVSTALSAVSLNPLPLHAWMKKHGKNVAPRVLVLGQSGNLNLIPEPILHNWRANGVRSWAQFLYLKELGFDTYIWSHTNITAGLKMKYPNVYESYEYEKVVELANGGYFDFFLLTGLSVNQAVTNIHWLPKISNVRCIFTVDAFKDDFKHQEVQDLVSMNFVKIVSFLNYYGKYGWDKLNTGIPSAVIPFAEYMPPDVFKQTRKFLGSFVFVGDLRAEFAWNVLKALAISYPQNDVLIVSACSPWIEKGVPCTNPKVLCEKEKCPSNLKIIYSPKGDSVSDEILSTASIALDFSWSAGYIHDNTKLNLYLSHGLPVVTNRPSMTYRWGALFSAVHIISETNAFTETKPWIDAVGSLLQKNSILTQHSTLNLASYLFSWKHHIFELYQVIMANLEYEPMNPSHKY